jgi:hypothetical protein
VTALDARADGRQDERTARPGLSWSVKRQFLRYIAGMSDGRCSVTDGAELGPAHPASAPPAAGAPRTDQFWYPLRTAQAGQGSTTLAFTGEVRFSGHHGFLFVRIADPVLTVDSSGHAVLTIAPADPADTAESDRLELAHLRLTRQRDADASVSGAEALAHWLGTDVRLTPAGAELFGGAYSAGETFDDLHLTIPSRHQLAGGAVAQHPEQET